MFKITRAEKGKYPSGPNDPTGQSALRVAFLSILSNVNTIAQNLCYRMVLIFIFRHRQWENRK